MNGSKATGNRKLYWKDSKATDNRKLHWKDSKATDNRKLQWITTREVEKGRKCFKILFCIQKVPDHNLDQESGWGISKLLSFLAAKYRNSATIFPDTSQLTPVFDKALLYKPKITVRHSGITCIPSSVRMWSKQTLRISSKKQNDFYKIKLCQWQTSPGHVNSRIMRSVNRFYCNETGPSPCWRGLA